MIEQTDNWQWHKWTDKSIWYGTETDQMKQKQTKGCSNMNVMIDPFSAVAKQTKWVTTDKQMK